MHFNIPLGGMKSSHWSDLLLIPLGGIQELGTDTPAPYPYRSRTHPLEEPMSSSCCSTDGTCSTGTTSTATATEGVTTAYAVSGMTCGHCKATLTKVIGELDGVTGVEVDLDTGRVTVTSATEPDDAAIAEVVDDAGYELTGRA